MDRSLLRIWSRRWLGSPGAARTVARAEVGEHQVAGAQLRREGARHARRAVRRHLSLAGLGRRERRLVRQQIGAQSRPCGTQE